MFTPTFASIFLFCATLASASPTAAASVSSLVKRATAGCVATILTNTINAESAPFNRIGVPPRPKLIQDANAPSSAALANSQELTDATVTPLVNAVVKVLEGATAVLEAVPASGNMKRHTEAETASVVFDLVVGVTEGMEHLLISPSTIPSSASLLASVDSALNLVLVTAESSLPGLTVLAAQSLAASTFIPNLQAVDFQLTLITLGIISPQAVDRQVALATHTL
ncbi:hypothetical protein C8J57DRAFT_1594821 [Mycena rebaudengoi]|nr:hypothetical protein C8J57DRAFT_1594821 [Mycena rebaudengoi]